MDPRDRHRDSGYLTVIIVVVVLLAGAGGAFWILRSHPAPKAAPHQPCEPLGGPTGQPSFPAGPIPAGDWSMSVTRVLVESTLPNSRGVPSFRLPSNLVYLVVETNLQNAHPGQEAELSSSMFELACEDGTMKTPDGLDRGHGFCQVCSVDIGVSDESLSWSFAFKVNQGWTHQAFGFRYGTSEAIMLPAPT